MNHLFRREHHPLFLRTVKRDMHQLPRLTVLTIISIAIYNFGWGFADPFFSLFLAEFSDSYALIGFFTTIFTAASLLLIIPVGGILDRVRHSTMMNFAKVLVSIVALCYFFAGYFLSTPLLIIALLLNGITYALIWPATIATIRDSSTGKNAALGLGLFFTFRQLAWAFGLFCSLFFIWHFPIYSIFIPTMITPLISILFSGKKEEKKGQGLKRAVHDLFVKDKIVLRFFTEMKQFNAQMWWAYITFMLLYVVYVVALIFIPLFAESIGFSMLHIGILVITMNIPFILSFFSAEIADHSGRMRLIIAGIFISSCGAFFLAFFHSAAWHLFFGAIILVIGYSIATPSLSSIITLLTPKGYAGTGTSLLEFCLQLSMVITSPLLGFIIDRGGWKSGFASVGMLCAMVCCSSMLAFFFFRKKNRSIQKKSTKKSAPYVL